MEEKTIKPVVLDETAKEGNELLAGISESLQKLATNRGGNAADSIFNIDNEGYIYQKIEES